MERFCRSNFFSSQISHEDVSSGKGLRKEIEFAGADYKENDSIFFTNTYNFERKDVSIILCHCDL
jgi:hypothetical protein